MDEITRDIMELQKYLRYISSKDNRIRPVGIDGIFGDETVEAVRNFQTAYDRDVKGVVTPADFEAIIEVYNDLVEKSKSPIAIQVVAEPNFIFKIGDKDDAIYFLQLMLRGLSKRYQNIPTVSLTGVYDEQTENAVERFREDTAPILIDKIVWNNITENFNRI